MLSIKSVKTIKVEESEKSIDARNIYIKFIAFILSLSNEKSS